MTASRYIIDTNPHLYRYKEEIHRRFGERHPLLENIDEWSLTLFKRAAADVLERNLHQRLGIGDVNQRAHYADHIARACLHKMWAPDKLKFVPLSVVILSSETSPYHDYAVPDALMSSVRSFESPREDLMQFLGSQSDALDFVTQLSDDIQQIDPLHHWEELVHSFVDREPWGVWSQDDFGFCIAVRNIGDYRIIEWEQQNMVNGHYLPKDS